MNVRTEPMSDTARAAIGAWRLFVGLFAFQVLGVAVWCLVVRGPGAMENWMLGAALGSVPGVIAGSVWYLRSRDRREPISYVLVAAAGLLILPPTVSALTSGIPDLRDLQRRIHTLRELDPNDIRELAVYGEHLGPELWRAESEEQTTRFTEACADVRHLRWQHYTPENTVVIRFVTAAGEEFQLECSTNARVPGEALCSFVRIDGNVTRYYRHFRSAGLHAWLSSVLKSW